MLNTGQIKAFERDGFLVVDDVFDQPVLDAVRSEYAALLDELYAGWLAEGRLTASPQGLGFFDKLLEAYRAGCDWFPAV